ncbi:hypothetical protein [Pontibacter sp. G13]|uniref:hypothetical protein n=1 Tax=Pontibacter sp. G13 TaxID=3074898 RepID=UPI00288AE2A5|nr:hypothetical protein [Pontibacter sp. G13]WNJ20632.1 hypothetical protein RJD25_09120 [Pontibacter sp. G13]
MIHINLPFGNRLLALLAMICLSLPAVQAQKVKKSQAKYQMRIEDDMTYGDACDQCKRIAMIDAIEKAFGQVIIQGNSTYIKNVDTGEMTETTQIFNMMAETFVNGEWIETLDESCDRKFVDDELWVQCEIKGRVKEFVQPQITLDIQPLDCESAQCATTVFQDGESFYVAFRAPVDGFISIYLADQEISQRILPYREMPRGMYNGFPVKGDKTYFLFSKDQAPERLKAYVDEYEMYAFEPEELNAMYVIFSKKEITKPLLEARDDEAFVVEGNDKTYEMPMQLSNTKFQAWMASQRVYNDDLQIQRVDITIRKE